MKIIAIPTGFAIQFPFALKDAFRTTFPNAKWNATAKQWEVGPRSGKRLEQWVEASTSAAQAVEELDQQLLHANELEQLRNELSKIERETREAIAQREQVIASRNTIANVAAEIEAAKDKLNEARRALIDAKASEAAEKGRINALLEGVIDMAAIRHDAGTMARNMIPSNRQAKEKFESARMSIREQRDLLVEAGWRCSAIEKLATANVNRPDRDHPKHVLDEDWYSLWPAVAEQ